MRFIKLSAALAFAAIGGAAAVAANDASSSTSVTNQDNCKVVHLKPGEKPPSGALSSSVTAGNGRVSAQTSGGNGVTVHSGNGNVSSSVATTGSGGGTTTVTTSNGDCIIYVNPGQKEK